MLTPTDVGLLQMQVPLHRGGFEVLTFGDGTPHPGAETKLAHCWYFLPRGRRALTAAVFFDLVLAVTTVVLAIAHPAAVDTAVVAAEVHELRVRARHVICAKNMKSQPLDAQSVT